jgi:hypothetical protein
VAGYDVMVHAGLERFLHHRQREEIRAALAAEHGIVISSGEISVLSARFLACLERLHQAAGPGLRAALASDGGWPLHIGATGEDGRGTLLAAFAGWRQWVLGAWKAPTERAGVILPRLREVVFRFGPPCAIVRDLGRAMTEASQPLVKGLQLSIPVLACHLHFLRDIGKARAGLRQWQTEAAQGRRIPAGSAGAAIVRGMTQWILDYPAEGNAQGFPFDLPWLGLYHRCRQAASALDAFLEDPPDDPQVRQCLGRLRRILRPVACGTPAFGPIAETLTVRARLFDELRHALRLTGKRPQVDAARAMAGLPDVRSAVDRLSRSLRQRRSGRRSGKDRRAAIDIILTHLESHADFLWGHAIRLPENLGGGRRVADRTSNVLESCFRALKHGGRRRSGRKILSQDFEHLPAAAALAANLNHADYVPIVCGSLDRLPEAFAKLDARSRKNSPSPTVLSSSRTGGAETASLSTADRQTVRTKEMTSRIIAAAKSRLRKKEAA